VCQGGGEINLYDKVRITDRCLPRVVQAEEKNLCVLVVETWESGGVYAGAVKRVVKREKKKRGGGGRGGKDFTYPEPQGGRRSSRKERPF
jgi:hypothetical protein